MKNFLKFLLVGSFKNDELLNNSKNHKWWAAIIIGLISLIIAIVPTFVSITRIQGSQIISGTPNASLDRSLTMLSQYLNENNIVIEINDQGKVDVDTISFPGQTDSKEYSVVAQGKELLAVRVCHEDAQNDRYEVMNYMQMYEEGRTSLDQAVCSVTPRSYLIITEDYLYLTIYNHTEDNENTIGSTGEIVEYAQATSAYVGILKAAPGTKISSFYTQESDLDTCIDKWSQLLNDLYKPTKTTYLWSYSGIITAINVVVMALISLLIFILTHLRSARGEKIGYVEALTIVLFSSLACSVVSLVLGFVMSNLVQIGFVLCIGLRGTFLAMKASNPTAAQAK